MVIVCIFQFNRFSLQVGFGFDNYENGSESYDVFGLSKKNSIKFGERKKLYCPRQLKGYADFCLKMLCVSIDVLGKYC